jgi:hypothetical protein
LRVSLIDIRLSQANVRVDKIDIVVSRRRMSESPVLMPESARCVRVDQIDVIVSPRLISKFYQTDVKVDQIDVIFSQTNFRASPRLMSK